MKMRVSAEEKRIIEEYARADNRSRSNLLFHSVRGQITRSKKKNSRGEVIDLPERNAL